MPTTGVPSLGIHLVWCGTHPGGFIDRRQRQAWRHGRVLEGVRTPARELGPWTPVSCLILCNPIWRLDR